MAKKVFDVDLVCHVVLELDDKVIDAVDDEWRKQLYASIKTPQQIAEHIAYNMVTNGLQLSHIEGWADLPDNLAIVKDECWGVTSS